MPRFDWLKSVRTRLRPTSVNRRTRRAARLTLESLEAREVPAITLTVAPQSVSEAAGANAATGTITRDDDLSQSLTVNLSTSDTTEATVPATITLAAGQAQATFPITTVDDAVVDGTQTVIIRATGQTTQGRPFGLDVSFGSGGYAATSLRTNTQPQRAAIGRQADGKILAASELSGDTWQLTRLNADGSVDTSFGTNGVASTSLAATSRSRPTPQKIVVQSDGKILVGGMYSGWTQTGITLGILVRYNANGSLDTTFGNGGVADLSRLGNEWVEKIVVRPDGRIMLGLGENGSVFGRVAQLNANGTFDTSFGSFGLATLNLDYSVEQIALLPNGEFLVSGGLINGAAQVARVRADGTALDTTFGVNGTAKLDFGVDYMSGVGLALDSQWRIVYGGTTQILSGSSRISTDFAAGRLTADGAPDPTFAGDGTAILDVSGQPDTATDMVIQADDKIVLSGYSFDSTDPFADRHSALARFNVNGTPDNTFDGDGAFHRALVSPFSDDEIFGIALQPDSRLVVLTGWATSIYAVRFNMGVQTVNVAASSTLNVLDNEAANRAPDANNQSVSTNEDTALNGLVTATDADGDPLTYAKVSDPAHGTVTVTANGTFTYTPAANYNGPDSFTFRATDGLLNSNIATVSITVNAVNDAPVANPDAFTINEDQAISIPKPGVLVNDTDADGDPLTAILVARPTNGFMSLSADGSFRYIPKTNYNGTDSFTYKVNDGKADSAVTTVTITINAVNDAPVPLSGGNLSTAEDTPLSGKIDAVDPEGDSFTFALDVAPQHGTLALDAAGNYTYTPAANFNGDDSFEFRITDSHGAFAQYVMAITVTPANDAPAAADDSYTVDEDGTLTITGTPVSRLRMVSDPDDFVGNGQTYDLTSATTSFSANTNFDNGVSVVAQQPGVLGEFWHLDFAAADEAPLTTGTYLDAMRFPFQDPGHPGLSVSGDGRGANTLTGRFTVFDLGKDASGNVTRFAAAFEQHNRGNPPALIGWVMFNSTFGTGAGVLANDTDVDGDLLLGVTLVTGPQHGTLKLNADGTFSYTPDANFHGTDTFTYRANDDRDTGNLATVTINVRPVNDAPVAADQSATTNEDTPLTGNLSATDVDGDTLTYTKVSGAQHGQVQLNADGSYTYTPAANYNGPDSFTYKANDGTVDSNIATVSITINAVNDAPVADAKSIGTDEDTAVTVTPTGSDVEGDALTFALIAAPTHGSVTVNGDGSFTYTPAANYNGSDSFTYKANDGAADSNIATVSITVRSVNDAPVAADQVASTNEDTPLSGTVAATDLDGDTLTFSLVAAPAHGAVKVNADGTFTYTPAANYNGPDSFTFKANDGTVDSNIATVSITVNAVNDAPVADAKSLGTDEDTAITVTPTGSDVEGDALTFAIVTAPTHGSVTVNGDGSFTYTPAANYNGSDSFTYKANDGTADSASATVSITVNAVDDAPVANGASLATDEDLVLNGAAVATDADGDTLTYALVSGPLHGTLQLKADGSFAYTPAANYNGSDSFTYKANDGTADSNVATVNITVNAVNDAPALPAATFTLPENSPVGTVVGTVTGSDVEGDALTYSIIGGNPSGAFAINPATGQITVANVAALDFERNPTFTLTVRVADAGGQTGQAQITINLTDVPEAARVTIDILPGEDSRSVNIKSHGKIEVAILSTADFDASTVDVNSLRFGRTGQEDSLSRNPHGPRYRLVDVNGDGRLDLVVSFETEETDFQPGDTKGILTGQLLDGTSFSAGDTVSIKSPGR
jgi:uncharacterized delta-60 repeat protein